MRIRVYCCASEGVRIRADCCARLGFRLRADFCTREVLRIRADCHSREGFRISVNCCARLGFRIRASCFNREGFRIRVEFYFIPLMPGDMPINSSFSFQGFPSFISAFPPYVLIFSFSKGRGATVRGTDTNLAEMKTQNVSPLSTQHRVLSGREPSLCFIDSLPLHHSVWKRRPEDNL